MKLSITSLCSKRRWKSSVCCTPNTCKSLSLSLYYEGDLILQECVMKFHLCVEHCGIVLVNFLPCHDKICIICARTSAGARARARVKPGPSVDTVYFYEGVTMHTYFISNNIGLILSIGLMPVVSVLSSVCKCMYIMHFLILADWDLGLPNYCAVT